MSLPYPAYGPQKLFFRGAFRELPNQTKIVRLKPTGKRLPLGFDELIPERFAHA